MFIRFTVKNKQGINFPIIFNTASIKNVSPLSKLDGEVDELQALSAVQTTDGLEFCVQDSFESIEERLLQSASQPSMIKL